MTTITITSRATTTPEIRQFAYKHSAITWLLLAGFLPVDSDDTNTNLFRHLYTGALAQIRMHR